MRVKTNRIVRYLSVALAMDVVHHYARACHRHPEPLLLLERALGIFVAALPMLAHGGARKLIILGVPLICFLLVDQLQDRDLR